MRFTEENLTASICKERFYRFFEEFWPVIIHEELVLNWHIEYLCDELQKMAEAVFEKQPKEYDLLINIPFGTTKSTVVSQMFPAWVWTRFPSAKFVCVSYAQAVAHRDSVKMRDIVQSEKYRLCFPGVELKEDANRMSYFANTKTGFRLSAGLDGQIMSFHGHFIIVDDPLNPKEAVSDAHLRSVNNVMSSTLPSRRIDKRVTPTILVQQRLHQNDPSGEMMERAKNRGGIRHICLPGELTPKVHPPELAKRYVDGLLDAKRLDRQVLDEYKNEFGAYEYAGQILQDPVPLGGGMFKTDQLQHQSTPPIKFQRRIRSWDKAACLIAGTMITTARGTIPIEQVVEGDFVPTREGVRRVEKSWMSNYVNDLCAVVFSNGTVLAGTPDHPVACGNEWIELSKLKPHHQVICQKETMAEKFAFTGVFDISATQTANTFLAGDIFIQQEPKDFIEQYGRADMGVFPVATISTTRTEIGIITKSVIWNVKADHLITESTQTVRNSERPCTNGMEIRRIVESWKRQLKRLFESRNITFVRNAATNLPPKASRLDSAKTLFVEEGLTLGTGGGVPVYDLQVEGCPEFYANGILVHNTQDGGAYSAGVLMGLDRHGFYWILDVVRGRWSSHEREERMRQTAEYDGAKVEIIIEVEGGSGGKESGENSVRNLAGYNVTLYHPTGDKEARAYPLSSMVGAGNVRILDREWTRDFIEEMRYFPNSKYKDQVDAVAGAFNRLAKKKRKIGGFG